MDMARQAGIRIQYTTKQQLDELCERRPHQNVALQVGNLKITETERPTANVKSILLADIKDPQNVGSIIRSAAYFGVERVYLTEGCSSLTSTVSKASAGSLEWYSKNLAVCGKGTTFLSNARQTGWRILATGIAESDRQDDLDDLDDLDDSDGNADKTMLVFGNEGSGIRKSLLELCNGSVNIKGVASATLNGLDSLNVGVAAALFISSLASVKDIPIKFGPLDGATTHGQR
jgi:21S rRNA (GM2251-2'-O)-methyltransferase